MAESGTPGTPQDGFTPEILERIVIDSLAKGDIESVGHAMRLLAVRDPHRARELFDTMEVGMALVDRERRG